VPRLRLTKGNGPLDFSLAEEIIKLAPNDPRCAALVRITAHNTPEEKQKAAMRDRAIKEYPKSEFARVMILRNLKAQTDPKSKLALESSLLTELHGSRVARAILGERRQHDAIGKPFELVFVDAIHASTISIERLRGRVVVVDFWATWCAPCVAAIPHLNELYAKYHEQGVEFIGISADRPEADGGLASLKRFVEEKAVPWPQFYDGGDARFTQSWGVRVIPTIFVVDAAGNLVSPDAREKLSLLG
jgi:thiol-disulfide isomerase/thioredoxin